MAFNKPKINSIKPNIKNVSIYLRSTKKFGKTTLFRDVILEKYGDASKGLLIGCGSEIGYNMLDNINVVQVKTYAELNELVDWLIETKGIEHNIEIVAFDTADELVLISDAETIRIHNKDNPMKKVKSIKAALGGYTAGEKYSANDIIKPLMNRIQSAGFGLWAISHTKFKTIKEKGSTDTEGYMQLTSNLSADYESAFGDIFDIVLTGVVDKATEERDVGNKTKKFVSKTSRKLYFRETELIDAGGRFAFGTVPEYLEFDKPNMARDFIDIIENGMENSKISNSKDVNKEFNKSKSSVTPKSKSSKKTVSDELNDDLEIEDSVLEDTSIENTLAEDITIDDEIVDDIANDKPKYTVDEFKQMFISIKDSNLKSKIADYIKENYQSLKNVDDDGLEHIVKMMG